VATKTESEREFRIRPRRPRTPRENEVFSRYEDGCSLRQKLPAPTKTPPKALLLEGTAVQSTMRGSPDVLAKRDHRAVARTRSLHRPRQCNARPRSPFGDQGEGVAPPEVFDRSQKAGKIRSTARLQLSKTRRFSE
jgi:hypothetical protein